LDSVVEAAQLVKWFTSNTPIHFNCAHVGLLLVPRSEWGLSIVAEPIALERCQRRSDLRREWMGKERELGLAQSVRSVFPAGLVLY
jgi:hypothetical protein